MLPLRRLPIVLLAPLCGPAFGDQPTATEACLRLADRSLAGNPQQERHWQEVWVDAGATREEAYDGEIEGQRATRRLQLQLRRGDSPDGRLTCFLDGKNQAISAKFHARSDAP